MENAEPAAPARLSGAPKTSRLSRASRIAPAHMAHGSVEEYNVHFPNFSFGNFNAETFLTKFNSA